MINAGEWIQIAVGGVLTATLLAVLWYAWETREQAEATRRIAEASMRPVLAQYIGGRVPLSSAKLPILYRNIGNGPAINIKWTLEPSGQTREPSGQTRERVSMSTQDIEAPVEFEMPSDPPTALVPEYQDASGNRWRSRQSFIVKDGMLENGSSEYGSVT